jgi:8-oxo-dGTP pyrophosphatase MutT (NUDIX family)
MKHKISTGVLIFKDNKLLLIKHVHPDTGYTWWVAPGGGIEGSETLFEAAKREVWEEAGLNIEAGKIAYIRQLIYRAQNKNVVTFYLTSKLVEGKESTENIHQGGQDKDFIKEIKYFSKEEIQDINVFPEIFKTDLWDDLEKGFPETKFIGVEKDKESE